MKILFKQILAIFILAFTLQVSAVDGVLEINQTCAVQTGCFSGDSAGFPVTINRTAPGLSFRLTSDIIFANENTDVIELGIQNITIDLNGFSLIREDCYKKYVDCSIVEGTGNGISYTSSPNLDGATIKNGSIIGVGRAGISLLDTNIHVENMRVAYSGSAGIVVFTSAVIKNNKIFNNKGHGISVSNNSIVTGNTVVSNRESGISAASSLVSLNTTSNNGRYGISCGGGCNINSNIIVANDFHGIALLSGNLINSRSLVQSNTIHSNGSFGIICFADKAAYKDNIITDNFAGSVSACFDLGHNYCGNNGICP